MTGNDQPERQLQAYHHTPADAADRFALGSVKFLGSWPTRSSSAATAIAPSFWKQWLQFPGWSAVP
jgi:hypothetical protein